MTTVRSPSFVDVSLFQVLGWETYDNEDPAPAFVPSDTIHEPNSICEDSTKCTCKRRSGEKERNAEVGFCSLVPHRKIEHNSREESTFSDTEEESSNHESRIALCYAQASCNNAP